MMVFVDEESGARYVGELRAEAAPSGHVVEVLNLTPAKPGGVPRKVWPYEVKGLRIVEASLREVSALDGAGYLIPRNPRKQ